MIVITINRLDDLEIALTLSPYVELRIQDALPNFTNKIFIIRYETSAPTQEMLFQLGALAPEFIDVPYHGSDTIFKALKTKFPHQKLIASFHDFEKTPNDLEALYKKLRDLPCDAIKIVTKAHSALDGLYMLTLLQKYGKEFPFVAFCMGEIGSFTRILQPLYNGSWTYACVDDQKKMAEGQLSLHALQSIYHYHLLNSSTVPYALIGNPIDGSPSHHVHNAFFRKHGYNSVYVKIQMDQKEVEEALPYLESLGFQGLSVTMPLKRTFNGSPINTVVVRNGMRHLYNTDASAVMELLEEKMSLENKKLLVVGCGATGEAIAKEASKKKASIFLMNRTKERAHELAKQIDCRVLDTMSDDIDCVVNATPSDIEWTFQKPIVALDVRNTPTTTFLEHVFKNNGISISGQEMWIRQASKQLALFLSNRPTEIEAPPSKSHTLRAILFASLADGISTIENALSSPDTESMIRAVIALGATIERTKNTLRITGIGTKRIVHASHIDAGNSGIVLRFIGGVAALFSTPMTITGDASMQSRRSCISLIDGLQQLGAKVTSNKGHVPLTIQGPIHAGTITIDGQDSQPVSALLIALSLRRGTSRVAVRQSGEKPWLEVTCKWLEKVGVSITKEQNDTFTIEGRDSFSPFQYRVTGDWSSASFLIVAALLRNSELILHNVDLHDSQGDKIILEHLEKMGATFTYENKCLAISGPQELHGIEIDVNDSIDAIPILAVCGCFAKGKTKLINAKVARDKESDRLATITRELRKMGASIIEEEDSLTIFESTLHARAVDSYGDHRIAMSLAVASFVANVPLSMTNTACVQKSYPHFFEDLAKLRL